MRDGKTFKRYLQPKIKALGYETDEEFAVERMKLTKAAISNWWQTGKIKLEHLDKLSHMEDLGAPMSEMLDALLRGQLPADRVMPQWEAASPAKQALVNNVRRMATFVPNKAEAAAKAGISLDVLLDPEQHLQDPSFLDLDHIAEALNTKPWVLVREESKGIDKRLDFVEELLHVVGETTDEGRQAIIDAMKSARLIGQLTTQLAEVKP